MNAFKLFVSTFSLLLLTACRTTPLENTAQRLNRDFDLVKSPYQYRIDEEADRLDLVLRKMPVGESAADTVLRADVENAIAKKLDAPVRIVEIRIFETQPSLRREIWVAEHEGKRLAFDLTFRLGRAGVDYTLAGPVEIQGAL
jgi:hypothetical protein